MEQLTETRSETVDASAAELRRIERDLHDGAQAQLVALSMNIGLAEEMMKHDPETAQQLLAEAREASGTALTELRDLVRGIHPPVLAERGLDGAVRALALTLPLPVDVHVDLPGRADAPVESAAYFAVAEMLANVVKHSGARRGWIQIEHARGRPYDRRGRRDGRCRPRRGRRDARHRAQAGGLRRDDGGDEPARRTDRRDHGAAVRVVIAEDLALLRDGLIRLLGAFGFEVVEAVDNGRRCCGRSPPTVRTSRWWTSGSRRRSPTRG